MTQVPTPSARAQRIAVIASRWHSDIVDQAVKACVDDLASHGIREVDVIRVPGAYEIPLQAQRLARSGEYAAIGACALVINGGIYRHEFVASTVVDALMRVQLETDIPTFSAVLTPLNFHEHDEHHGFFRDHFVVKGRELACAMTDVLATSRAA
jgi:6,7-dimethyl-8-ribityllumazine synthase